MFKQAFDEIVASVPLHNETYIKDGLKHCSKCNKAVECKVVVFDEEKIVPCICQCRIDEIEAEERARKEYERLEKIKRLKSNGFPDTDMQKFTFENDNGANPKITQAMKNYVAHYEEFRQQGKGLLLYGDCGTGKTFFATCIANALMDKGVPCLVTNFSRIINTLQSTFEKQEYIDSLNQYSLLVLDDLGIERETSFAMEQVYNVVDSRYRAGLPMIITTNLSMDKIKKPPSIEYKRIYDRVLERCHPVLVNGQSHRKAKIIEDYENTKNILGI